MPLYRKKPTIVHAEQWFPGKQVDGVIESFYAKSDGTIVSSMNLGSCITIHGQQTQVAPGDWIITEPDGIHHYPCKPDIFENTYELVENQKDTQDTQP